MPKFNTGKKVIIFSDFDGTITQLDTLQYLLDRFGAPDWMNIENQVKNGEIFEIEALQAEFDTLNVSWEKAISGILEDIKIDPDFPEFVHCVESMGIPLIVLSGGVEEISKTFLEKYGLERLALRANKLQIVNDRWVVVPSDRKRIRNLCNHCKTYSVTEMKETGWFTVYIGDGLTDRCPAVNADLVFAKKELAEYFTEEGKNFISFEGFRDIKKYICNDFKLNLSNLTEK